MKIGTLYEQLGPAMPSLVIGIGLIYWGVQYKKKGEFMYIGNFLGAITAFVTAFFLGLSRLTEYKQFSLYILACCYIIMGMISIYYCYKIKNLKNKKLVRDFIIFTIELFAFSGLWLLLGLYVV